jgi:hypothetical protein
VALLYPGDRAQRQRANLADSRFHPLAQALAAAGLRPEACVWHDDFAGEVRAQLAAVQAVLVWCNPIEGGRRRETLDALLRDTAAAGVLVSTHPDTVLRLGTKDLLLDTRDLPFGSDVHRIDSPAQLAADLPARLAQGARVLKQHRGHSGQGVWRVALQPEGSFLVRPAQRGSAPQVLDLAGLQALLAPCFEPQAGGHLLDQAWQPAIAQGMLRAYLVGDQVAGFGHQAVNALHPDHAEPGPRLYHDAHWPGGQALKALLHTQWLPLLSQRLGLAPSQLPLLWDADFIGPPADPAALDAAAPRYVLCEANVSSVSPYPASANAALVAALCQRLAARATPGRSWPSGSPRPSA